MTFALPRRSFIAALHDTLAAALSFIIALYLRLGIDELSLLPSYTLLAMTIFTLISMTVCVSFRLYRSIWHFASIEDLLAIIKAATLTILIFAFLMFTISRLDGFPRSALIINWFLLIFMLAAPRFAYRIFKDRGFRYAFKRDAEQIPILLYGSGAACEIFVRDSLRGQGSLYKVVGIMDAKEVVGSRTMHGIKIYGGNHMLPFILRKLARKNIKPQRLVLTEEVQPELLKSMLEVADCAGLTLSRLPRIHSFEHHQSVHTPTHERLKPVDIEDLLGRAQTARNPEMIQHYIAEKTVLITGAGGSIGAELCRQLILLKPTRLILYELNELALYQIDYELTQQASDVSRAAILGDVRDAEQLQRVLQQYKPDLVFHAAALKHVPLTEENISEALKTNVFGTLNVMEACECNHVPQMVLISTDKAVNPTNILGASKRLAEQLCASDTNKNTQSVTVRFGNVLGSTGSVIPLFQKQLAMGGPLTVTHPDITRYFMTIREAVDLILHAAALASQNKHYQPLYVLDMGEPVKIADMARQMIRLAGLRPEEDIKVQFVGLRRGEKLFEELFYPEEAPKTTSIPAVMQAEVQQDISADFRIQLAQLANCCKEGNDNAALALLKTLVPEFTPNL